MKKLIVYRHNLLPISETFIAQQLRNLTDWQAVLVGERRAKQGLDLSDIKVCLFSNSRPDLLLRVQRRLHRLFGIAIPHEVKILKAQNADLIHVHFGDMAVGVWPSIRRTGLPMLVTLHGHDINKHEQWWLANYGIHSPARYYPRRLKKLARHPRVHFIAVSEAIRQRAIEYGIPAEKLTLSYIGVDTNRFRPQGKPITQRSKRILFVGRMVEKKAPQLLVQAFAEVRKAVPDAELAMIGKGPLWDETKDLANKLNVPVEFLGAQPSDEVERQMHQARVFCLPSVTAKNGDAEGFGMVILEAQACGVPVVTSARGGATEGIIDGQTGIAFDEGDLTAMANGLIRFLREDELATEASTAAVQYVKEHFDIRKCSARLESIYDNSAKA